MLAGPILRRVTATEVSVWIALSKPCAIALDVFRLDDRKPPESLFAKPPDPVNPLSFGPRLHIAVVTVELKRMLSSRHVHGYDLTFIDENDSRCTLSSLGLPLTYPPWTLPTFVVPPRTLRHLRIFHGSCREPHGLGDDALPQLDRLLSQNADDPSRRPQQLLLTGDQIYAEDVAGPQLAGAVELANRLFGQREALPGDPDDKALLPYMRYRYLERAFNPDHLQHNENTRGHSIRFAEMAAMYLMVWSDAAGSVPALGDLMRIFVAGSTSTSSPYVSTKTDRKYDEQKRQVERFRRGLPEVRRLLANIATYMIFDDHEVTDDWYLDRAWAKRELTGERSRWVIRNALSAYAVFQAWGNDPAQFAVGDGRALLEAIAARSRACSDGEAPPDDATLDELLGIPPADQLFDGDQLARSKRAARWSYRVPGGIHELVVLDTRTRRALTAKGTGLVPLAELQSQLGVATPGTRMTVVVSAAPLVPPGWFAKKALAPGRDVYDLDAEDWDRDLDTWHAAIEAMFERRVGVVLSGDIHMAAAAKVSVSTGDTIACFVSSPLCNQHPSGRRTLLSRLAGTDAVRSVSRNGKPFIIHDLPSRSGNYIVFDNHLAELFFTDVEDASCTAVQRLQVMSTSPGQNQWEFRVPLQR